MIGQKILHYKITKKLGEGGMGVVYKAEDTKLERTVAIKFLPRQIVANSEERERFQIEAKAAAQLNHPNIATIHAIEEVDDEIFIVMEYIEGKELQELIQIALGHEGFLPINTILAYATQIASGLHAAHKKDITHRDIKSSNIMITEEGQVKIMDFGLAKVRGVKFTKVGTTLGTAAYMSPEKARGEEADERADIWSFGVVLYEMLTGKMPFPGDYEQAVIYSIMNEDPRPITESRHDIPEGLASIVNKCFQKEANDRYQNTEDLQTDLRTLTRLETLSGLKTTVRATGRSPLPRLKFIFGGIAAVIVLILAGYLFVGRETAATERVPIAVVDFVNQTNEPELDGLSGMLITALEQSRRLSVFSRARLYDEFKQMNRPDLTFVDETTGIEISKRANISALAVATIRNFDNLYTIDFKVIEPQTGHRLFSTKVEGEGKKSIPGMLDQLSEKTRIDLKEQEEVVQLTNRGVADVTTTSLEAYQHYFKGEELINKSEFFGAAEKEFNKAIALDSTFALAYFRLAYAIAWFTDERAKEPLRKALALIDRIPEKERYLVRALNAGLQEGGEASLLILKEMERIYPDDKEMLFQLADRSFHLGQYTQAVDYFQKVLVMDPTSRRTLDHLAWAYQSIANYDKMLEVAKRWVSAGGSEKSYFWLSKAYAATRRFEPGLKSLKQARELSPENYAITAAITRLYTYQGKYDEAEVEAKTLVSEDQPSEAKQLGYRQLREIYAYLGRYREIMQVYDRQIALSWAIDDTASAIFSQIGKADYMVHGWNDVDGAWQEAVKTVPFQQSHGSFLYWDRWTQQNVYSGKYTEAEETAKRQGSQHQFVQSLIHSVKGECSKARSVADMHLKGLPGVGRGLLLYRVAVCQYEKGEWQEAIGALLEVQGVHSYSDWLDVFYPKSFYLLGKVYEAKGDKQLAIENTEKFLDLRKDADPDLPDLIDAKHRLARLKGTSNK